MDDHSKTPGARFFSARNAALAAFVDGQTETRAFWREHSQYYHDADLAYTRFLVPEGSDVLEVGCGDGALLAGLKPRRGVGVDFSTKMIAEAQARHPHLEFHLMDAETPGALESLGGKFDVILCSDTVGYLEDIAGFFAKLKPLLKPESRVIVSYYSRLWEPALQLATKLGMRMPTPKLSWLSTADIEAMMALGDMEFIRREWRQLIPRSGFGIGLWVVGRLVEAIGGEISIESRIGEGSTFTVLLPLCAGQRAP